MLDTFIGYSVNCGTIQNPAWTWSVGDKIYLNGTSLSTIAPSTGFCVRIGTATAVDRIEINISPCILL